MRRRLPHRPSRRQAILGIGVSMLAGTAGLAIAGPQTYEDPDTIYAALRDQRHERLILSGGMIHVVFADGAAGVDRLATLAWIRRSATAMSRYFGQFPIARYGLLVIAEPGTAVGHATTYGYAGPVTRIHVGTGATAAILADDWVLVHEMLHAALPNLPRRALWLQEGNATYVEPIARARAGQLPPVEVWRQLAAGLRKGEPRRGDAGMDGTRRWGRLYWGGATFWLRAEIAIAEQSHSRHGLRDALRAINEAGGDNSVEWLPERMMRVGDAATGTTVLTDLYARFAKETVTTDLGALFARLGVVPSLDGGVRLDDRAPLASVRRAITAAG